jgi:outer membrane protein TolC
MQPYNSLIALSVSAVFAIGLVKIDPAQAESAPDLQVRTEAQDSPTPSEVRQQRLAEVRRLAQAAPSAPEATPPARRRRSPAQPPAPLTPTPSARPAPPNTPATPPESAPLPTPNQPSTAPEARPKPPSAPAPPVVVPTEPLTPAPSPAPSGTPSESAPLPSSGQKPPAPNNSAAPSDRPRNANAAPESLNPSPNPLNFPTTPGEVTITGSQAITLQQAIELAVRNSPTLQQTRLELAQSRDALREAQAANSPTLDATSNLTGSAQESLQRDRNAQGVPSTTSSSRNTTTSLNLQAVGLQADYSIFTSGQRSSSIRAAEGTVRFRELAVEVDTKQLVLDVSTSYYDLQEADKQVEIFQAALSEALQSLRDAQALERAGVGTRFDVLQSQVDAANARQDLTQQLSRQEIARRTLAQRLSLAQGTDITAADEVAAAGTWELSLEQSVVTAFKNRAELEQQLVQRDIGEQRRRNALGQLGPQISARATYGLANLLTSSSESSIDSTEGKGFFNSGTVALNASINLFDGGQARAQARQQEANIAIAESQFVTARDQVRFQVEQAYSTLQASSENIQTTTLAVQSAEEALRLARLRFQAGVGTQTDVIQQQTALTRSRVNNLQAVLDYNRALAQLQRFVSNLPDGNLSETP